MRPVLLTGATGFVGRQVLRVLTERCISVRPVVRQGKEHLLPLSPIIESPILTEDLFSESADWWAAACAGVDTVIHVAWYAEPRKYQHAPKNLDCLAGTLQMAKGAAQARVRRFVGVGTCFEYDLTDGILSIDTPLRPTTLYAAAKAAAFAALSQWFPVHGIEFCWCRLFYLYGEGEDCRRLLPYLHSKLKASEPVELTTGEQIRDFLDVRDAGRLIADAALSGKQGPLNICSGVPVTVRQLAERIADQYGRRDLLRFGARPTDRTDPHCVVGARDNASR